jgi:hypothetical protein
MLRACVLSALLVPLVASATPRRALTSNDIRIDRTIGDGNGWVDDLEAAVANAAYEVNRTTGMNIRPRLATLPGLGGLETRDAYGARVYIARTERPETVAFTVFHEAGHVAYRHDTSAPSQSHELWADEYAGRLVAATHHDIRAAIADYRTRGDALHGTGAMRAAMLLMGYLRGGGTLPSDAKERLRERLAARLAPARERARKRAPIPALRR